MSQQQPPEPRTIIVPGTSHDDDQGEVLVRSEDIESTSRSCLAIIVILLIIALMICAFLAAQPFLD
jgi:hypothetical protein